MNTLGLLLLHLQTEQSSSLSHHQSEQNTPLFLVVFPLLDDDLLIFDLGVKWQGLDLINSLVLKLANVYVQYSCRL